MPVQAQDQPNLRMALSHIYYYLPRGAYSRFHKNRYDEVWNLYSGEGLRFILFDQQKRLVTEKYIRTSHLAFHLVVPGGVWQASEPIGDYALVGCTVAPGWEIEDEVYLFDNEEAPKTLSELKPEFEHLIPPGKAS